VNLAAADPPERPPWWRDAVVRACLLAGLAGAAALLASAGFAGPALAPRLDIVAFFFIALTVLQVIPIRIFHAEEREDVSLREAFIVPMVLLLAPWQTVLLVGLSTALAQGIRRAAPLKALFNIGQTMVAGGVAVAVVAAVRGATPGVSGQALAAAAVAGFAYALVSAVAVAGVIAVSRGFSFRAVILEAAGLRLATWAGSVSFGALILAAYAHLHWALLLTVAPILALQVGFTSAIGQRRGRQQVESLYRAAAEVRSGIDREEILARLLAAAIPLLDARESRYVELGAGGEPAPGAEPVADPDRLLRTPVTEELALEVVRAPAAGRWSDADRRLARTIADVAASALDKARLFEEVKHQALYDALTGLPNQVLLVDRVSQALAGSVRTKTWLCLIYIDLDNFKRINDSLGHAAGDDLLKAASRRLEAAVRASDTVARMSGDEFVLLMPSISSADDAAAVGQKIIDVFAAPFDLGGLQVYCSASAGIALCPDHGSSYGTLLQKSDLALYEAKARGRGTYCLYTPSMSKVTESRLSLEADLRRALHNDELRLLYQAQIDLPTGAIVGAEALVRWQHPTLGLLGPDRFIPLAEDLGLVRLIDHWVLEQACAQVHRWQQAGLPPLRVAVNLSGADFGDPSVADSILDTIRSHRVDPARIEVEVTESLALKEGLDSRPILQSLRDRGVGVAIDDFGTGHSTLARLGSFPIDVLKIDKSFIDAVGTASEAPLVVAIIAMAHSLSLQVVAEGVERVEQREFLNAHGCDRAQGYLFAYPVPPAQFEDFVRSAV
jgi:diguanylate cyclase (GGDEF)-like protein